MPQNLAKKRPSYIVPIMVIFLSWLACLASIVLIMAILIGVM